MRTHGPIIRKLGHFWANGASTKDAAEETGVTIAIARKFFRAFGAHDKGCPSSTVEEVIRLHLSRHYRLR